MKESHFTTRFHVGYQSCNYRTSDCFSASWKAHAALVLGTKTAIKRFGTFRTGRPNCINTMSAISLVKLSRKDIFVLNWGSSSSSKDFVYSLATLFYLSYQNGVFKEKESKIKQSNGMRRLLHRFYCEKKVGLFNLQLRDETKKNLCQNPLHQIWLQ